MRDRALARFERLHDDNPDIFRLEHLYAWWEELEWRYVEEVDQIHRTLLRESGRESMRLEEIQFRALAPDADGASWLRLPGTFDLDNPGAWFQAVILPRWSGSTKPPFGPSPSRA